MASEGRKFDLKKKFLNGPMMYPEALGVALRVAKHSGTILASLETVWDNLKKIEKNRFFPSIFLKSLAVLSFASGNFLTGWVNFKDFFKADKKILYVSSASF